MPGMQTLCFCTLVVWGLVLSSSSAERQYFPQNRTGTWVDARRHCQVCFKELVTLTPENTQNIARGLNSEHWIGLRKRPLDASDNSTLYPYHDNSTFWSSWANGDPLAFQNWYPGYPVFKSPYPRKECCSCSCTCPAKPTTHVPFESECVKNPMLFQEPDPDENYIEDPCVAMLKFGAWVEKECSELLPYICYEDRFYGEVRVTNIKSSSANIAWDRGPGDISHYRVEVKDNDTGSFLIHNLSKLTHDLSGLEPGTSYLVQVFPVKCGRDLNPENQTFYTVPNKVTDLQVVDVTENCVSMNWMRPTGKVDLYKVETVELEEPNVTRTENVTICGLTSGNLHTFIITSGVNDRSQHSEKSTIDANTKPGKVSNLNTSDVTDSSLVLSWDKPPGSATGYRVETSWDGVKPVKFMNETKENKGGNKLILKDLPSGTKITLSVTALANGTLEGESQTVDCFTKPKDISELNLNSTNSKITAKWSFSIGSPHFTVELFYGKDLKDTVANTTETTVMFPNLNSAANYTVTVFMVTEETSSKGFSKSIFTKPNPPRNLELSSKSTNSLTFTWKSPFNTGIAQYLVILNSSFWGQEWKETVTVGTTYTFNNLKSGTNYAFQVQTMAGSLELLSRAEVIRGATDSIKREITLSMVCSSQHSLLCDSEGTRDSAFKELKSHFQSLLGDHVVWNLKKMETENPA